MATQEATWLQRTLKNLANQRLTVPLYVNKASALKYIDNPEFYKRTKYNDIKYHFIRLKNLKEQSNQSR